MGDLLREQKEYPDARKRFEASLAVVNQLLKQNPDKDEWAQAASQLYTRIGDLDVNSDLAAAQSDYENSMKIAAAYYQRKPDDESWQRELAWPYAKLADVSRRKGDAETNPDDTARKADYSIALEDLDNSLCLRRQVAAHDKTKTEFARDVPYTLDRVAAIKDRLKEAAGAEAAFFESLALRRDLAKSVPDNALYVGDIAQSLQLIGDHYRDFGDAKSALAFYDAAAAALAQVIALSPTDKKPQQDADAARKRADAMRTKVAAAFPAQTFSGNWWQPVVRDAENVANEKLRDSPPAAGNCLNKVEASVEQIAGPLATGSVR